jgi:hypothetical protein
MFNHVAPEYIEYLRQARRALTPFRDWLIRVGAYTDQNANLMVALVCRAIWDSGESADPVESLEDLWISRPTFSRLKHALVRYYVWQLAQSEVSEAEKNTARNQLNRVQRLAAPGGVLVNPARLYKTPEMPQETFLKLLTGLKAWHKKHGPRWPWAYPLLSIKFKLALSMSSEMPYIAKDDLVQAWSVPERKGTITVWKRRKKGKTLRTIPIGLILDEAEQLIHWPWDWGILADITNPQARPSTRAIQLPKTLRVVHATYLKKKLRDAYLNNIAQLDQQLRNAAWVWLFKKLKYDWIALGQVTGQKEQILRSRTELLSAIP